MNYTLVGNKFNYGDIVYGVTDPDQFTRMVTAIILDEGIGYQLDSGTRIYKEIEISFEKNLLLTLGVDNKEQNVG